MENAINNPGMVPPGRSRPDETSEYNPPPSLPLQIFLFCAFLITVVAYVAGQRSERTAEQTASRARDYRLVMDKGKYLAYTKYGFQAEEQKHFAAAVSNFQSALTLENTGESHYNLGNALLLQGRTNEALKEFQTALTLDPRLKTAAPPPSPVHGPIKTR